MSSSPDPGRPSQKAIFFDLMGTCCNWLSSLLPLLQSCPPHPSMQPMESKVRQFAIEWREGFFKEVHARFERREPAEDIDLTHRRVLDSLLKERGIGLEIWDDGVRSALVRQWHLQVAWPDVIPALEKIRHEGNYFLIVLANGTTRLQLDIAQSSGIPFHMLLSSELLGLTKPDPSIYCKAMELTRLPPNKCLMVASHLYDLEAAKSVGMETIYVHRTTEDVDVKIDLDRQHKYVDWYYDGREGMDRKGFLDMAERLISR
ncbi:HAD-like protein [Zopfia rhizophila CBS 207.26]|uniref:HAD-like protein n=1 Tax=Zopfia rhizophila CBS 207.26 TaxID=1314779 RepID=A0A6A6DMR4_9PEZI|nr:HAD-like protein [Zopfia rhizophila CBS 207.26]